MTTSTQAALAALRAAAVDVLLAAWRSRFGAAPVAVMHAHRELAAEFAALGVARPDAAGPLLKQLAAEGRLVRNPVHRTYAIAAPGAAEEETP
ncbi:MAG: hypothetical protein U0167_15420 [bacterium]